LLISSSTWKEGELSVTFRPPFDIILHGCNERFRGVGWRPRITWCSALTRNKGIPHKRDHSRRSGRDSAAHGTESWHPSAYIALTVFVTTNDARLKAVGRELLQPPGVSIGHLADFRAALSWAP
jgi:hypothetical protein